MPLYSVSWGFFLWSCGWSRLGTSSGYRPKRVPLRLIVPLHSVSWGLFPWGCWCSCLGTFPGYLHRRVPLRLIVLARARVNTSSKSSRDFPAMMCKFQEKRTVLFRNRSTSPSIRIHIFLTAYRTKATFLLDFCLPSIAMVIVLNSVEHNPQRRWHSCFAWPMSGSSHFRYSGKKTDIACRETLSFSPYKPWFEPYMKAEWNVRHLPELQDILSCFFFIFLCVYPAFHWSEWRNYYESDPVSMYSAG